MKSKQIGTFEYRVHCAGISHQRHEYRAKNPEHAAEMVAALEANNAKAPKAHVGCHPFIAEARFVTEWTTEVDDLELRCARLGPAANLFDSPAVLA